MSQSRTHVRYKTPTNQLLLLERENGERQEALKYDESYGGLSCIYLAETGLAAGEVIDVIEGKVAKTPSQVIRCEMIHPNVFKLALKFVKE